MSNFFDFSNIYIDTDNTFVAGISYYPSAKEIIGDTTVGYDVVLNNEEYRPDKIAYRLFRDQNLSWVLDILNEFENGVREYTRGKSIKKVSRTQLEKAGIL